jgi:hypothetical protein
MALNILVDKFGMKPTGNVDEDLAAILNSVTANE